MNIFEACRSITAADIAERIGLQLKQRGKKQWACCPIHGEKTASLKFDENGRWHCFGCGRGGDAIAFYGALYNLPPQEAAERLASMFGRIADSIPYIPPPPAPERLLREKLDAWFKHEWDIACSMKHRSKAISDIIQQRIADAGGSFDDCCDSELFWQAIKAHSNAEIRLEELFCASKRYQLSMMLEERDGNR